MNFKPFYKKYFLSLICIIMFFLILPASTFSETLPEKTLSVATASQGGAWYTLATRVMSEVEKEYPGISIQIQPGGSILNVKRINENKANLVVSIDFIGNLAIEGKKPFDDKMSDFRFLFKLIPGYTQIITLKSSNIQKLDDLISKRFSAGPMSGSSELVFEMLINYLGFNLDTFKEKGGVLSHVGLNQAAQMMRDGLLDGYMLTGNPPINPVFNEIALTRDIEMLNFSEDFLRGFVKKYPYMGIVPVPQKTYKGVIPKGFTIASDVVVYANTSVSNETAYALVKTFYGKLDEMKIDLTQFQENTLNIALEGNNVPIHPGALKFYKEVGLTN